MSMVDSRQGHGTFIAILPFLMCLAVGCAHTHPDQPKGHSTERFQHHTLPNGLQILTLEDNTHPVIGVAAYITTGGRTESAKYAGSLHFIEHLVFKGGTKRFEPTAFRKRIAALGRENGGWTWDDEIQFGFEVPKHNFRDALDVMVDSLLELVWTRQWFEDERNVVLQEIEKVDERPWHRLWRSWDKQAFQVHPYGRAVIGSQESIRALSFSELEQYYRDRFRPNQLLLTVVGDFDTKQMVHTIAQRFRTYEAGPHSFELSDVDEPNQQSARNHHERDSSLSTTKIIAGFRTPGADHPDTAALMLWAELLSSKSHGLPAVLQEQTALATSVNVTHTFMKDHGTLTVTVECLPQNAETILQWLRWKLTEQTHRTAPTRGAVDKSVSSYNMKQSLKWETYGKHAIGLGFLVGRMGVQNTQSLHSRIQSIRPIDLHKTAQKYFRATTWVEASLGPRTEQSNAANLPNRSPGNALVAVGDISWKSNEPDQTWIVTSKETYKGITLFQFANGLRLLVKPVLNSSTVSAVAYGGGGQANEPEEQAGISMLTSRLLTSGTEQLSLKQWNEVLDRDAIVARHGLRLGNRSNIARNNHYRDGATLALQGQSKSWPLILQLLGEALFRPVFPEDSIRRVRDQTLSEITTLTENNLEYIKQEFYGLLYPDHPYGRPTIGTKQTVSNLTQEQIVSFHNRTFIPANFTVAIVGGVEPERVANLITNHWKPFRTPHAPTKSVIAPQTTTRPGPLRGQILNTGRKQRCINMGMPALPPTDPNYTALEVMFSVVHGHHFYKYVYERGVSYRSWLKLWPNQWSSTWILENDVNADSLDQTLLEMQKDLRWYATGPFAQEQIALAKAQLINETTLNRQNGLAFAFQLARFESTGRGYQHVVDRADKVRAVSLESINDLAKQTFEQRPVYQLILK